MSKIPHWKVKLEDGTWKYFFSGTDEKVAKRMYESIFNVKVEKVISDDGKSIEKVERERFSVPKLKVIIAGSRSIESYLTVKTAIEKSGFPVGEVVSGTAQGADEIGEYWAEKHNVPIKQFPADWAKLGNRAGMIRNGEMADYADALVLVWDGKSRGSAGMLEIAKKQKLRIHQEIV